eukprot:CAMPEP_0206150118 /NCGR_PEP_ID=MMETSP1473-20131121/38135_1 /ASSEMBLY_ACC=CAM_ASM_001109 /TAXON_ID=1461547 /ORGANISM="Stichococcus sp, Strain RCC1054" /LENGTH=153 /DNA_ID=CAMNT_0053547609 /DNA_START=373 /DNA_END=835 /DNA_ORIENTATION=-
MEDNLLEGLAGPQALTWWLPHITLLQKLRVVAADAGTQQERGSPSGILTLLRQLEDGQGRAEWYAASAPAVRLNAVLPIHTCVTAETLLEGLAGPQALTWWLPHITLLQKLRVVAADAGTQQERGSPSGILTLLRQLEDGQGRAEWYAASATC